MAKGQALAEDRQHVDVIGHHHGTAELPRAFGVHRAQFGEDGGRDGGRSEAGVFFVGADGEKIVRVRNRDAAATQGRVAFGRIAHGSECRSALARDGLKNRKSLASELLLRSF